MIRLPIDKPHWSDSLILTYVASPRFQHGGRQEFAFSIPGYLLAKRRVVAPAYEVANKNGPLGILTRAISLALAQAH